jgi:hypothetical protein
LVPYFATGDVEASAARATELGATVVMAPMAVMEVGSMALVSDPTGVVHGLWQAKQFAGFGVQYEPNTPGWFDHGSKDPAAAAAYYVALTGHSLMEPEPGMKVLHAGEQWFASFSLDEQDRPGQWNPIYIVDTLARAHDVVRQAGGTIVVEEQPVPGSTISVFLEPVMNKSVTVMGAGSQSE